MYDRDVEARIQRGRWMVRLGIVLLVVGVVATWVMTVATAGEGTGLREGAAQRGFDAGESPFTLLGFVGCIALVTLGQVTKSNARREGEERFRRENFTSIKVVPDPDAPGGPFRGGVKEVEVLDPAVVAADVEQRARDHARGKANLIIGGVVIVATVALMAYAIFTARPRQIGQRFILAFGMGIIPFGFGLFFAIRGLILRSK